MCYGLYLGSDAELPVELAGDSDDDRMWLRELEGRNDKRAATKFTKAHVYYVASWQDCGCGWVNDLGLFERPSTRKRDRELTRTCVEQLRELVERLISVEDGIELYFTWAGEESKPVKRHLSLTVDQLGVDQLQLDIGDFAVVSLGSPS